ncbi:MAG: EamA family transporter [Chthoniobacterales bacterium]
MRPPSRLAIVTAFAALYIIWGSTYLGILLAIQSIPPLLMAGTRFLIAGVILYTISRWSGAPKSNLREWRTALIVGACLLLGGNGGVTLAEQYVPSGLAALLVATVPLYIALLSWLFGLTAKLSRLAVVGLAGGFAGVAVLVAPALSFSGGGERPHAWIGMCILLFSSLVWSAGSLYARHAKAAGSPFLAAGQQMLCGGSLMLAVGSVSGEWRHFDPAKITMVSLGAFVYLVLVGGIVGYVSYAWLLRHCEPSKVATYAYVNPVVAVLLGSFFAGEKLTGMTLLAAAIIIGSVALVITAGQLKRRAAAEIALPLPEAD